MITWIRSKRLLAMVIQTKCNINIAKQEFLSFKRWTFNCVVFSDEHPARRKSYHAPAARHGLGQGRVPGAREVHPGEVLAGQEDARWHQETRLHLHPIQRRPSQLYRWAIQGCSQTNPNDKISFHGNVSNDQKKWILVLQKLSPFPKNPLRCILLRSKE